MHGPTRTVHGGADALRTSEVHHHRGQDTDPIRPVVPRSPVLAAILSAFTLAPGVVPLGMLFGATATLAGFSTLQAGVLSVTLFAGVTQLAAVAAYSAGDPALAVLGVVVLLQARYLLLSTATVELGRRHGHGAPARTWLALGTVEESYALQAAWARRNGPAVGLLVIPAALMVIWTASTLIGAQAGTALPDLRSLGLDYALPGLFIGLLGIFSETRTHLVAGLVAVATGGALALIGQGTLAILLLPPLIAYLAGRHGKKSTTASTGVDP